MIERPNQSEGVSCFAVQLQESLQPIAATNVTQLSIFREFTVYAMETNCVDRARHSLRLGFFVDAVTAEYVAHYVRRFFPDAIPVPVGEVERTQASDVGPPSQANSGIHCESTEDEVDESPDLLAPADGLWAQPS